MRNVEHSIKLKIRAMEKGMFLKDIAARLRSPRGTQISAQRFSDMINGDPRKELEGYKDQIARILGSERHELFGEEAA